MGDSSRRLMAQWGRWQEADGQRFLVASPQVILTPGEVAVLELWRMDAGHEHLGETIGQALKLGIDELRATYDARRQFARPRPIWGTE